MQRLHLRLPPAQLRVLSAETKHINKVIVKTKFCWLYVVICLLFVLLAGLVIERWA